MYGARIVDRGIRAFFNRVPWILGLVRLAIAKSKRIVVLGGHGGLAFDDNGRALAVHLKADGSYKVFWVYRSKKARLGAERAGLTALRRGSLRSFVMISAAHLLAYSHGTNDLTTLPLGRMRSRATLYLGHGVWGLKRVERRSEKKTFDYAIASSDAERSLKAAALDAPEATILVTGLPKHDLILSLPATVRTEPLVLYAPTWRDWLQERPSSSALKLHFSALDLLMTAKPELSGDGRPFTVEYLVHANIRGLSSHAEAVAKHHNVKVSVSQEIDVATLLSRADYLITDYSALLWDYLILGRPAARFVFDEAIYSPLVGYYSEIEKHTEPLKFTNAEDVWAHLFDPQAPKISEIVRDRVLGRASGRASERLELNMDVKLREAKIWI